ncbi:hypothetical protein RQP53_04900 [Paucibacter sp. APW11]|uniref:Uncharacterized protein n=1 Tax=Roseateles aquae TaxID=3077235 RepID=A0ABU3P7S0_9BURK|nr:hypothetical protein [Paucibacter sp. APW11]MDT8998605.1 hypothetical protein [Paucibacter sp. APW11]
MAAIAIKLALLAAAPVCVYLGLAQQRWLARPWRRGPAYGLALLCGMAGGLMLAEQRQALALVYTLLTVWMLALVLLPHLAAARQLLKPLMRRCP